MPRPSTCRRLPALDPEVTAYTRKSLAAAAGVTMRTVDSHTQENRHGLGRAARKEGSERWYPATLVRRWLDIMRGKWKPAGGHYNSPLTSTHIETEP